MPPVVHHTSPHPRPSLGAITTCACAALALAGVTSARAAMPRGTVGIHDPSTLVECDGRYYVFGTGYGIVSRSSADRVFWEEGPPVFSSPPAWTGAAVPGFDGVFWAPDVIERDGTYFLYYSCSLWQTQTSAIGVATSPTLDPTDPGYGWTDQGMVIQSTGGDPYNTIDPSVMTASDGKMWMAYGSYWNGIYVVRLDPLTGKINARQPTPVHVAGNSSIEAACLFQRDAYYYLVVNWGSCCSGIQSTYHMRIGRAASPTGPFLDRNGQDLRFGGGTLFLEATGRYTGPGHFAVHRRGSEWWFGYHYYDTGQDGFHLPWGGEEYGVPAYDLRAFHWTADDWPVFTNDWEAVYRFAGSGRDEGGQFFGLLRDGATVRTDATRGTVLDLDGSGAHVRMPVGVGNARTFTAMVRWDGGGDWQRIFDFGRDTSRYCLLTTSSYLGRPRFTLSTGGIPGEQVLDAPSALTPGVWTHFAVTVDDDLGGVLYVDGTPVAGNPSMSLAPFNVQGTNNTLGLSQFPADPPFDGRISSFRAYGRALAADEIVAPHVRILAPADGELFAPGQTVTFRGYATDFRDVPIGSNTWWAEHVDGGVTNSFFGPVHGTEAGSFVTQASFTGGVVRLHFSGTDGQGRTSQHSVDLFPDPEQLGSWTAFYPFDNGVEDAGGAFDGVLQGGAATVSIDVRGSVLDLPGAAEHVRLPPGVTHLRTFASWVRVDDTDTWQRVFDFGRGTTEYCLLTAHNPDGVPRFSITTSGPGGERTVEAPDPLPLNTWTHLAVVLDGPQAVMFVNGEAVAVNHSVNLLPSDVDGLRNYLGRSQWRTDPYLDGQLDSVLIGSRALEVTEFLPLRLGLAAGAGNVTLTWPAGDGARPLHRAATMDEAPDWAPVGTTPATTHGMHVLTLPASGPTQYYRTTWPE